MAQIGEVWNRYEQFGLSSVPSRERGAIFHSVKAARSRGRVRTYSSRQYCETRQLTECPRMKNLAEPTTCRPPQP